LIKDGDIRDALDPDDRDVDGMEEEPPMDWDVIHTSMTL